MADMSGMMKQWCGLFYFVFIALPIVAFANEVKNIPILCYHNFNPTRPGSMNLRPQKLEAQIQWLQAHGFTVVPLQQAVDYLQGKAVKMPQKPVVITADDGWQSVYTYLVPLAKKYRIPVTLFIYPQTISSGKNAMTWEQLKELQQTGLFDIQSHTYWHPNFKKERKARSAESYQKFVQDQLTRSKQILEEKMGTKVSYLAWPFGIYDEQLEREAQKAGYVMAFSIDHRHANKNFRPMQQPRFMIIEGQSMATFAGMMNSAYPR